MNTQTYQLQLVGGSATSGGGVTEYYSGALEAGTYYFAVLSSKGNYSSTNTYSVQFEKIGDISTDTSLTKIYYSQREGKMIYQCNSDDTVNYVNGHKIDISYAYKTDSLINSAGIQKYDISIDTSIPIYAGNPVGIMYYSSTRPAMENIKNQHALMLTYGSVDETTPFYKVHCFGSGAYQGNTYDADFNAVTVAIDPESGKLIDIINFNYFYDFAPVGSNNIIWARVFGDMVPPANS